MPEKTMMANLDMNFMTALWVSGLASFGGVAGYVRKIRHGLSKNFSLAELIGEVIISCFVGIITYLLCDSQHIDPTLTAALVGISGHMGSRAIYLAEFFVQDKLGLKPPQPPTCDKQDDCPIVKGDSDASK